MCQYRVVATVVVCAAEVGDSLKNYPREWTVTTVALLVFLVEQLYSSYQLTLATTQLPTLRQRAEAQLILEYTRSGCFDRPYCPSIIVEISCWLLFRGKVGGDHLRVCYSK